jgi:hypothetical protein
VACTANERGAYLVNSLSAGRSSRKKSPEATLRYSAYAMNSPAGDSDAGASEHCSARLLGIAMTRALADKMVIAEPTSSR